jgi:predicted DNA-binding antitoxin AbrB/MazE fold protein
MALQLGFTSPKAGISSMLCTMQTDVDAIYENGLLRPLKPLPLAENTRVRISVETLEGDNERVAWLAQSERRLREVWENEADDVFNELLAR